MTKYDIILPSKGDMVMDDYEFKEEVMRKADKQVVEQVLMYFKHFAIRYNLPYKELSKLQDTFIYNYVELSKYQKEEVSLILKQKKYKQQALLNECIYEALSSNPLINIEDVPLINKVTNENNKITLETRLGIVKLGKASEYFKDTKSAYIFNKKLACECFDRILEFVKENEEYDAIVSYIPNIFVGGHYHAYAKCNDTIVDSASNTIYFDNTGTLIERGDIIFTDKYSNIGGKIGEEPPYLLKKALK